jgi:hypothetical protein
LRTISRTFNFILIILALLYIISRVKTNKLPPAGNILPSLEIDPLQTATQQKPFDFSYQGAVYHIVPKAKYIIQGLVISHNNISGIGDMYHTSKSVDVKDLCLAWGKNTDPAVLNGYKIWSEPWCCHFQGSQDSLPLDLERFSNNHLLAATAQVKEIINSVDKGDQVRIEGMLIDYNPSECPECVRASSLVRTDTGDGACEVIFVEKISILNKNQKIWNAIRHSIVKNLWWILMLRIGLWIFLPWYEYKYL